jgi:hypothetical protein
VKIDRTLLVAGLLAVALPAAATAAEHPRLFFKGADVADLRARAGSSHRVIADGLKGGVAEYHGSNVAQSGVVSWPGRTFTLGDRRDIGNSLVVFAFTAQLDGSPETLALAKRWLLSVAGFATFDLDGERDLVLSHLVGGVAVAYDILHPQLTEAERTKVRDALSREADRLMAAGQSGLWWETSYTQNHNWINHAAVGLAGLALDGESPRARAWTDYAAANAAKISSAISGVVDGTWHEGWSYLAYGLHWHLPFVEALRRSGGPDHTDLPLLRGIGAARAYAQIPEAPHTFVLASGDFFGFNLDEGLLALRYAASRFDDRVAQLAADRWQDGTPRKTFAPEANQQVFEFLFYDPSVPAADPATLPLDWFGADLQAAVFRSGWEKGATIFALKSGSFGGRSTWERLGAGDAAPGALNFSHDHADDNGFYLYANGAWAAPEAQGYYIGHADSPGPQANQTVFHNSMLVDGQGQLGSGVRPSGDNGQSYGWFFEREGSIPFRASSRSFGFATGDGARLYARELGVQRWDRHALFLDREHVVLWDVLEAAQPRAFTWLSHFTGSATQEGRWIRGRGENGQALGVAMVAPAGAAVSFATQAPVKAEKFVADGSFTVAEVKAPAAARTAFLTALVPVADAAWGSRPSVEALDAARPEVGLVLAKGGRRTVAVFGGAAGQGVSAGGVELAGLAGVAASEGGAPDRALLVRGSSLAQDGKDLLRVEGGTDLLEADGLSGAEVVLSGSELKAARVWAPNASRVLWYGDEVPFRREGEHVAIQLGVALAGAAPVGAVEAGSSASASGSGSDDRDAVAGDHVQGGGCGSAGPGDFVAVAAALGALYLLGRARRRAAVVEVRSLPPRRRKRDDLDDAA